MITVNTQGSSAGTDSDVALKGPPKPGVKKRAFHTELHPTNMKQLS